jgi:RluA family pseudouridine synthase
VRPGEAGPLASIVARAGGDDRAIAEGRVFVGRQREKSNARAVAAGDTVSIAPAAGGAGEVAILVREKDFVAADKPAGMPTIADQTGAAHTLVAAVANAIGVSPTALHPTSRLDRDVSGVVVFTRTAEAARRLKAARDEGAYVRRYVAVAQATPSPQAGTWDAPIGRASDPRKRRIGGRDAAPASSRYATTASVGKAALLALSPVTGRTHQLRVHASHAGAALYGDRDYGGPMRLTHESGRVIVLRRVALHAARVTVPGAQGAPHVIEAPVPRDLVELWRELGGEERAFREATDLIFLP